MDSLIEAVLGFSLTPGTRILIAVSGGPDSMALLDTLYLINRAGNPSWTLMVGHVNHGLRPESDADEKLSESLTTRLSGLTS